MRPVTFLLFLAVAGGAACSGSHESLHDRAAPSAPGVARGAAVDVPNLLPLSIDEMTRRVGPLLPVPAGFSDPTQDPRLQHRMAVDSAGLFRYRGLALVVGYNQHTRRVSDLLLLGSDENELMRRAQLKIGAANYLVLPVFEARRPTQLMGLRVLATSLNQ